MGGASRTVFGKYVCTYMLTSRSQKRGPEVALQNAILSNYGVTRKTPRGAVLQLVLLRIDVVSVSRLACVPVCPSPWLLALAAHQR